MSLGLRLNRVFVVALLRRKDSLVELVDNQNLVYLALDSIAVGFVAVKHQLVGMKLFEDEG